MTAELQSQIQTAAFCAYIMRKENVDQHTALRRMAEACTLMQVALGLEDIPVRSQNHSERVNSTQMEHD